MVLFMLPAMFIIMGASPFLHLIAFVPALSYTNEVIPANVTANNRGFNDRRDFDYTTSYQKADNERVVLFTEPVRPPGA